MSRVDQHATLHALADRRSGGDRQVHADHHPLDSQFADNRQLVSKCLKTAGKPVRHHLAILQQAVRLDRLHCRQPRGHCQRIATERAGVHARFQATGILVPGDHHTTSHATGQSLGNGHHVRLHPVLLVTVPGTCPRHACLNLVENQQGSAGISHLTQPLQESRIRQVHSSLALDRLDQDRAGFRPSQLADSLQVIERGVIETGHQWANTLVVFRLSRRRGGPECSAVETVVKADDAVATGLGPVQSHQFQRPLDRLGPTVAKEGLSKPTSAQRLGKLTLRFGVPGVGNVDQSRHLLLDGSDHPRRTMAQDVAAPAREQVEVPIPLGIPHRRSLTPHQANRVTAVVGDHVLLELRDRLLA